MHSEPSSENLLTLFQRLATRDRGAFGELCRRFRGKLLAFARCRVRREPELRPIYDEDDAFSSGTRLMWQKLMAGELVPPDGLDAFLRLARTIIAGRIRYRAHELKAGKRHRSVKADDDGVFPPLGTSVPDDLDLLASDLPAPEVSVFLEDDYRWLMSLLGPELRQIVELRTMGQTIDRIAERQGKSRRTIERMFQEIRGIWEDAQRDR